MNAAKWSAIVLIFAALAGCEGHLKLNSNPVKKADESPDVITQWLDQNVDDPEYTIVLIDGPLSEIPEKALVGIPCGDEEYLKESECYQVRFRGKTPFGGMKLHKVFFVIRDDAVKCAVERNKANELIF